MKWDFVVIGLLLVMILIACTLQFCVDNKHVGVFFSKGIYSFSTGKGLKGITIIKASVGPGHTCELFLTNRYTKKVTRHYLLKGKCHKIFFVWDCSKFFNLIIDGEGDYDFVIEIISFYNRK